MQKPGYYVGWISVDGAGSQKREFPTIAEAKAEADRLQARTDVEDIKGIINPLGHIYWVAAAHHHSGVIYRTTPSVRPGTSSIIIKTEEH